MTAKSHSHISVASVALFFGGLLWVAAFWFPVFETADRNIAGYWVFVSGWMGFVVLQFAWYANLFLLIAVILMYSAPVRATIFAAVGLLIATQAFWFDVLPETTESVAITAKGLGFWFWYGGIFLMSVGVFFCLDSDEVTDVVEVSEVLKPERVSEPVARARVQSEPVPKPILPEEKPVPEPPVLTQTQLVSKPTVLPQTQPVSKPPVLPQTQPVSKPTVLPQAKPVPESPQAKPVSKPPVLPQTQPVSKPTVLPQAKPVSKPTVLPQAKPVPESPVHKPTLLTKGVERRPVPKPAAVPEVESGPFGPEVGALRMKTKPPEIKTVDEVNKAKLVLDKTDEELEMMVPVVTSILQDAVFPEIKKPK